MKRLAAIVLLVIGIPMVVAVGLGAKSDGGSGYEVRAIFDNAAYAVPGEEVRVTGEKYVECTPGTSKAPELDEVPDGQAGAGKNLLPLAQTSSPVDVDLINDI